MATAPIRQGDIVSYAEQQWRVVAANAAYVWLASLTYSTWAPQKIERSRVTLEIVKTEGVGK